MDAHAAAKQVRQNHEIIPSRQFLAHLAEFHNKIHGFENVDVMDESMDLTWYSKVLKENENENK